MTPVSQSVCRREAEISEEIEGVFLRLRQLYDERRGRLVEGLEGQGWCVRCGQAQVNAAEGFDTCARCTGGPY